MKILSKQQLEAKERRETYYLNPKLCKECKQPIDYDKRLNVFCGHNCSATHNNNKRGNNFRSEESKKQQGIRVRSFSTIETNELCEYGCGNTALFELSNQKKCCSNSVSSCSFIKKRNSNTIRLQHETGIRKSIVTFTSETQKKSQESRLQNLRKIEDEIMLKPFEEWRWDLQRRRVFKEQEGKCLHCKLETWNDKPITLELDHINGVHNDNRRENLRFLCPNCHSQTETYKGKNIGKKKVSDEELLQAFKDTGIIYHALEKCGLVPKGGNYDRIRRLIE